MLIIVTRMWAPKGEDSDEFCSWCVQEDKQKDKPHEIFIGTRNERVIVVIHGYKEKFIDSSENPQQVAQAVIEAIQFALQELKKKLNLDNYDLDNYEKGILFHPPPLPRWLGEFKTKLSNQVKREIKNCKWVQDYSGRQKEYNMIENLVKLAKQNPNFNKEFDEIWDFFASRPPVEVPEAVHRLSILKHRLIHLFLPIDIDLQGLIETGFQQDYWDEVVKAYEGGKALEALEQARALLYGQGGESDYVEKIVKEVEAKVTDKTKITKINCKWKKLQKYLPPEQNNLPNDIKQILQNLGCRDKLEDIRQKCQDRNNPFHQWFDELNKLLDELRDAIEEAQEGSQQNSSSGAAA